MEQTIQRRGNTQDIRIPKATERHRTVRERLEAFYGKPFDEIPRVASEPEVDWGKPRGHEVW